MTQYDAIVIGTGQSGPSLAKRLAGEGWKVAIIERDKFGGTCVNTGCTPTKTLVASAEAAYIARRAADLPPRDVPPRRAPGVLPYPIIPRRLPCEVVRPEFRRRHSPSLAPPSGRPPRIELADRSTRPDPAGSKL